MNYVYQMTAYSNGEAVMAGTFVSSEKGENSHALIEALDNAKYLDASRCSCSVRSSYVKFFVYQKDVLILEGELLTSY